MPSRFLPADRSSRIGIGIALAVVAAVFVAVEVPRVQAYGHWRAARAAIRADDFELAAAHLALCRRARPSDPEYAYEAARVARRAGDLRSARTLLATAANLGQPVDDIRLEELLGAVQESGWRGKDETLLAILERRPADAARIREVLARAFYSDLLLATAIEHANAWAEAEPWSGNAWQLIGDIKAMARDQQGSRDAYHKAVERDPGLIRSQVGLADALFRQLQTDEAVVHYQAALATNPRDRDARVGLTRAYLQMDRLADAAGLANNLVAEFPQDAEILGLAGRVALLDGRVAEAEPWLTRSTARVKNLVVLQDLQATLSRRGKVSEAKALDEQIAQLREDFKHLDQLSVAAQTSLEPAPRVEMGKILIRNGLQKEGVAWLYDALRCAPGYRPAHQALADHFTERGRPEEAERHRRLAGRPD